MKVKYIIENYCVSKGSSEITLVVLQLLLNLELGWKRTCAMLIFMQYFVYIQCIIDYNLA